MDLILSTRNPSKAEQIKAVFAGLPVRVLTLEEAGVEGEAVEDGTTLSENAAKKALFGAKETGKWCIADDTGLFIDALDGRPGIHAARWAGDDASTEDILNYTLNALKDVPGEKRTAAFRTVAVLARPDGTLVEFMGEAPGSLLEAPRVPFQPKMPYSAIFVPEGGEKSWAEMTVEEENKVSHRGKAFGQLRDYLASLDELV